MDDYSTFALHPLIPMMTRAEIEAAKGGPEADAGEAIDFEEIVFEVDSELDQVKRGPAAPIIGPQVGYGSYGGPDPNPPEYKLVRFYDFATDPRGDKNAPKPGRKYVYRVRVAIDDPNFPSDWKLQPPQKTLHPEAYARIKPLIDKARTEKVRDYMRWTDWSEPSPPASLPSPAEHFVGKINAKAARPLQIGNKTIEFQRDAPTASMVISQFSPEVQTRLPLQVDVTEGSVLAAEEDHVDLIDPINLDIRKLRYLDEEGEPIKDKKVSVVSDTAVISIMGGSRLDIDTSDGMTEPGYMLLFDPAGGLRVQGELEDLEDYRLYTFADETGAE